MFLVKVNRGTCCVSSFGIVPNYVPIKQMLDAILITKIFCHDVELWHSSGYNWQTSWTTDVAIAATSFESNVDFVGEDLK